MTRRASRKYAAFLSFADPDRELVEALHAVLERLGLKSWFAPTDLPMTGTPDWREAILEAIRKSSSFVPIVTRSSITRPWVLFECGVAEAEGLEQLPARVASVRPQDTASVPRTADRWIFDLSTPKGVVGLVSRIQRAHSRGRDSQAMVTAALRDSPEVELVVRLAGKRSVFIAGSVPADASPLEHMEARGASDALRGAQLLEYIAGDITSALLDAGFDVMSCPEVDVVGKSVGRVANRWLIEHDEPIESQRYTIGGLHPIDRQHRDAHASERERQQWARLLLRFRESYLIGKEWLLVLGGNIGTREEVDAAKRLRDVCICGIPAIGGTGLEVYREVGGPLSPTDTVWSDELRTRLVNYLLRRSKASKSSGST